MFGAKNILAVFNPLEKHLQPNIRQDRWQRNIINYRKKYISERSCERKERTEAVTFETFNCCSIATSRYGYITLWRKTVIRKSDKKQSNSRLGMPVFCSLDAAFHVVHKMASNISPIIPNKFGKLELIFQNFSVVMKTLIIIFDGVPLVWLPKLQCEIEETTQYVLHICSYSAMAQNIFIGKVKHYPQCYWTPICTYLSTFISYTQLYWYFYWVNSRKVAIILSGVLRSAKSRVFFDVFKKRNVVEV